MYGRVGLTYHVSKGRQDSVRDFLGDRREVVVVEHVLTKRAQRYLLFDTIEDLDWMRSVKGDAEWDCERHLRPSGTNSWSA